MERMCVSFFLFLLGVFVIIAPIAILHRRLPPACASHTATLCAERMFLFALRMVGDDDDNSNGKRGW